MSQSLLSRRVLAIEPSPSIAANALDTPRHILDAAQQAMFSGETHYTGTPGTPALLKAIVRKLARDNGLSYRDDEVIAGCGGKHIIYHALAATLNPGDEVIVHTPYWVSYPDIARLNEAKPFAPPR